MLSEILRKTRERKNITQVEIAKAIGITQQTYSGYENGIREPNATILGRIATILECTTDHLLGRE